MPAPETLLVTKIGESFDATPACGAVPARMWAGVSPVPARMWARLALLNNSKPSFVRR